MRTTFTLALVGLLTSLSAPAAPLRWSEVRGLALERNPQLKSAGLKTEASGAELKGAYGNFLPDLTASAGRRRQNEEVGAALDRDRRSLYSATASLNLFAGGATLAELRRARGALAQARADRDLTSSGIRQSLRKAFFEVAFQQDRIGLYERIVQRLKQNERLISLKYESGTEARWNVQKTSADTQRAEYNLLSARNGLRIARDQLAQLLQLDVLTAEEVEPTRVEDVRYALPSAEEITAQHPELRRSRAQAAVAEEARATNRAALLPSLDLNYTAQRENPRVGNRPEIDRHVLSLTATWNIFNGLTDYHRVQQANFSFAAAEAQRESDARRLLTEVRTGHLNYETKRAALPVAHAQREAASERSRTVSAQYRAGLKSYLEWEQSQSQLIEAEEAEVNAVRDALYALADAERAAGRTLEEP